MHLSKDEKERLFEIWRDYRDLLYDRVLQPGQKISGDSWALIPRGKKVALWYTYFRDTPVSILVDLDWKSKPTDFTLVLSSFHQNLAYGTILSGILFEERGKQMFCCTHVNMLCGQLKFRSLSVQTESLHTIMHSMIRLDTYLPGIIVCVPKMVFNSEHIDDAVQKSQIPIHCIRVCNSTTNQIVGTYRQSINHSARAIVLVKPEVEEDIYSLWSNRMIGYAIVPDYKTSVLLNSIFRDVKENDNLDLLEESDSEEEFENTKEDRFIKYKDGFTMRVEYIPRFNGWKPYEKCDLPPSSIEEIQKIESMFREKPNTHRRSGEHIQNVKNSGAYNHTHRHNKHPSHRPKPQWMGKKHSY